MSDITLRWMIGGDLTSVCEIDEASHEVAWDTNDFLECLRGRTSMGVVATLSDRVVGYVVYELFDAYLMALRFAVHPCYRRCQVGTSLLGWLMSRVDYDSPRKAIYFLLPERAVDAQLFLRDFGFSCVEIKRRKDADSDYLFRWSAKSRRAILR